MVTKKITSLSHPLVIEWAKLRSDKSLREKKGKALICGKKMACELPIDLLISTVEFPEVISKNTYIVTDAILKKITGLNHPDGYAAIVSIPKPQDLSKKKGILILDKISDPGNLGTLLRTALALNWQGVIFTPGTVDPFNDKALRAGKGAQFHLPYCHMDEKQISNLNFHFYLADLEGLSIDEIEPQAPKALILSSEGHGVSEWVQLMAQKITIPISKDSESLNVSIAGGIILYMMRPSQ